MYESVYRVLITTWLYVNSQTGATATAVHTEVVSFDSLEGATEGARRINEQDFAHLAYEQSALPLFKS